MDAPLCAVCGKSAWPAQAWMHKSCVAQQNLAPSRTLSQPEIAVTHKRTSAERQRAYRNAHGEDIKARNRERMRKARAA